jgi:CRISPR-associated protein Csm1
MNCRDQTVYSTLLHDVGKFMQRAEVPCPGLMNDNVKQRVCPFDKATGRFTHLHSLWTEQFFDEYGALFPDPTERFPEAEDNLTNLAAWHHKPSTPVQWVVTEAERMSSGMDRKPKDIEDETPGREQYKRTHLRSLFARVNIGRGELSQSRWVHQVSALTPEQAALFPFTVEDERESLVPAYRRLWDQFVQELENLRPLRRQSALFFQRLLWLWQKYAWCVPSSTIDLPDISLYDHSRTAAGIAACLYDYHQATDTWDEHAIRMRDTVKFRLLAGDLSGIQRALFAFDPTRSKGVAKTLRARSFYLAMVGEAAIEFILARLHAHSTQVFMNAGGRFLILLPNLSSLEAELDEIQRQADRWCRERFNGLLTLNLDWSTTLRAEDFYGKAFPDVLRKVQEALERTKRRKLHSVLVGEDGRWRDADDAFLLSERYEAYQREGKCESCGEEPAEPGEEDGMKVGVNCRNLRDLGRKLLDDPALVWDERDADMPFFGDEVGIKIVNARNLQGIGDRIEELNAPSGRFACRFMANHVPRLEADKKERLRRLCDDEEIKELDEGNPLPLSAIAVEALREEAKNGRQEVIGVDYLGLLKGDVDFLGQIFSRGLDEDLSISRYATLSRMLDLFFSGYLNTLTREEYHNTYTVYAGGDDFFLISDWENAIHLAERLEHNFRAYTCHNPNITLSVGLALTKPRYPIRLGADRAEEFLKESKERGRERLTVFGRTVTWEAFRDKLEDYFHFLDQAVRDEQFGTGFLYRLLKYHQMHLDFKEKGQIERALYRSRMSYDLKRNIEKRENGRVVNQEILDQLYRLFDLRTQDMVLMDNLSIPVQWALYRNRRGG